MIIHASIVFVLLLLMAYLLGLTNWLYQVLTSPVFTYLGIQRLLSDIGFGTGDIAAGSIATSMMSWSWTACIGVGVIAILLFVGAGGVGALYLALPVVVFGLAGYFYMFQ